MVHFQGHFKEHVTLQIYVSRKTYFDLKKRNNHNNLEDCSLVWKIMYRPAPSGLSTSFMEMKGTHLSAQAPPSQLI